MDHSVLIVLGSFTLHFLTMGVIQSFGLWYSALLEAFSKGKGDTGWIASLNTGMMFLSGPIAGMVTARIGCRASSILGSLLAAAGMACSMFIDNIMWLYFTYGVVTGLGFGLDNIVKMLVVNLHCDRRRSLAMGFAASGSGVGTVVLPILIGKCIEYYGWRGSFLILSGVCLQGVVFGALFKPPSTTKKRNKENIKLGELNSAMDFTQIDENNKTEICLNNSGDSSHENGKIECDFNSSGESTKLDESSQIKSELDNSTNSTKNDENCKIENQIDISSDFKQIDENDKIKSRTPVAEDTISETFREQCFRLMKTVEFDLLLLGGSTIALNFILPFVMLPDMMIKRGHTAEQAALTVMSAGISGIFGRILVGMIADIKNIDKCILHGIITVIGGAATIGCGFIYTYEIFIAYGVLLGIFSGTFAVLQPVIVTDIAGKNTLEAAFGMMSLSHGTLNLIGTPIGGWIADYTGSYNEAFYFAGASYMFGGIVMFLVSIYRKLKATPKA